MIRMCLRIVLLMGIVTTSTHFAYSQKVIIKSRDILTLSIGSANPLGPKWVLSDPTLLANMQPGQTFKARYATHASNNFYVGVAGDFSSFSQWTSSVNRKFYNTKATFTTAAISAEYRNWSPTPGWNNKIVSFASVSAGISWIHVQTDPDSEINIQREFPALVVRSLRFSTVGSLGLAYSLSNSYSIQLSGSYCYTPANSKIFSDNTYKFWTAQIGVSFHIFKEKRYKLFS